MTDPTRLLTSAALACALSPAAFAQSSDAAYCQALADKYQRYVNNTDGGGMVGPPPVAISEAISKCRSDPAGSIPVLEKALKNARFDLPPRS